MSNRLSEVFYGSIQHGQASAFASLTVKVDKIIDLLDFSSIKKNDKVAIKMHLGYSHRISRRFQFLFL